MYIVLSRTRVVSFLAHNPVFTSGYATISETYPDQRRQSPNFELLLTRKFEVSEIGVKYSSDDTYEVYLSE